MESIVTSGSPLLALIWITVLVVGYAVANQINHWTRFKLHEHFGALIAYVLMMILVIFA